jgi:putative YphP/YqiW family bacilliredoxin
MYPPEMTEPMRQELTGLGVSSLQTPEQVDEVLGKSEGTALVVVNSVCGCAAGMARPGVALALQHSVKPDHVTTVFAGVDREATQQARSYFKGFNPSSPQIALLKDGDVVFMLERHHIENSTADMIAGHLKQAFDTYCQPAGDGAPDPSAEDTV